MLCSSTVDSCVNATDRVADRMNRVSLDSIGIAGFSHDFGTLQGRQSDVADAFAQFGTAGAKPSKLFLIAMALGSTFPFLIKLPMGRTSSLRMIHDTTEVIGARLLQQTRGETDGSGTKTEKSQSIIGAVGWFRRLFLCHTDAECSMYSQS